MRFKRSASIYDQFFETPPSLRPDIDLGLSATPFVLPEEQREIDSGPTRFFDLVMGRALDDAARIEELDKDDVARAEGPVWIDPRVIAAALESGELTLRTLFFEHEPGGAPPSLDSSEAAFIGTVEADGDDLRISGGSPAATPSTIVYSRRGEVDQEMYAPVAARVVREPMPEQPPISFVVPIPEPYTYRHEVTRPLPGELYAAWTLGALADRAYAALEAGRMTTHGVVDFIRMP